MHRKDGLVGGWKRFAKAAAWFTVGTGLLMVCIGRWWPELVEIPGMRTLAFLAWISVSWSLGSAAAFTAVGTLALLVRAWTPGAIALATAGTRIDYVWTNSGLECVEAHVGDQSGSDHRPLIATLRAAR